MTRPRSQQRRGAIRHALIAFMALGLVAASCSNDVPSFDAPDGGLTTPTDAVEVAANPNWPIRVDQFGYLPNDPKVAVIADPVVGFDGETAFNPGLIYEVRSTTDDTVVFSGEPVLWSDGSVHNQSGDRGWWFDFTEVDDPGEYYIADLENDVVSDPFLIDDTVYDEVLDAALRMFWFNRLNVDHPAPLASPWDDTAAYLGPGQDAAARSIDAPDDETLERDLTGGWADAGDTNKYVTFASEPVHQLLSAFQDYPSVFDDQVGIPESGNGIPDIIDEVLWEIAWLERMQQDDGGVLTKVGLTTFNHPPGPPSASDLPRFYEEACSSATIAATAMFAHAAVVLRDAELDDGETIERLTGRALDGWAWFQTQPRRDDCDTQEVLAGDADLSLGAQDAAQVVAAIYLFDLTADPTFDEVVREGVTFTIPFNDIAFGRYAPHESDAVLHYRGLELADPATVATIGARIDELVNSGGAYGFRPDDSLYRSSLPDAQYHWGSNRVLANTGQTNVLVDGPEGRERMLAHLHTFHGVNPLATVYLSNMESLGAERSFQTLFHYWFGSGSDFDTMNGSELGVPPGYVVGGPNIGYSGSASPPAGQPAMKSYLDSNGGSGEPFWEISEPAIYYQSAYVRLLSTVLGT